MLMNDEQVWKLVEMGRLKIAEEKRLKFEREAKIAAQEQEKKQAAIDEITTYMAEYFPWALKYAAIEAAFENYYNQANISLRVEIPGFAPMIMAFYRMQEIKFEGVKVARMEVYRPDDDELGFVVWDVVFPQYTFRNSENIMDVDMALSRAQEQGALYAGALERWESVKLHLIEKHRQEVEAAKQKADQEAAAIEGTVINNEKIGCWCSQAERRFLDTLMAYINWLEEELVELKNRKIEPVGGE